jgi:VanW family protein
MVYRYLKNLNLSVRIKIMPNQILARKEELLDKKTREKNNNFEEENFKKSDIQNSQEENIKTNTTLEFKNEEIQKNFKHKNIKINYNKELKKEAEEIPNNTHLQTNTIEDTKNKIDDQKNTQNSLITDNRKNTNNTYLPRKSSALEIFLIFASIILAIFLICFLTFTFLNIKNTKIISNIFIQTYDVSNLTQEEAIKKINNIITSQIPEELTLKHNDYETSISTKELNIQFDTTNAVNNAYKVGRTGNLLQNDLTILQTKFQKKQFTLNLTLDIESLKKQLQDISGKLPDKVKESSYYIEGSNLILTKGETGAVVDVDKTASEIIEQIQNLNVKNNTIEIATEEKSPSALDIDSIHSELYSEAKDAYFTQNPYSIYPSENGVDFAISIDDAKAMLKEDKDEYSIPLKVLYPSVTTNMLGTEAFPNLLSQYSTSYSTKNQKRTTNLRLAANKINGTVLMPGETFSYNKVVGERTIAAGYQEAPIYVSGKVVDGLGGGICQITTTLYNAVVYANLEIVERSNHQFVPSYAPASRDATVVYGSIDFKFKNNRNYPIKILCSVQNGIANFQIYGLKTDNDYEVVISNRVTGTTSNAIYSEAYKILKQNGQVVSSTLLSQDVYKRH